MLFRLRETHSFYLLDIDVNFRSEVYYSRVGVLLLSCI